MLSALDKMIDFLRTCASAPAHEFPHYARQVDQLERVPMSEAGDGAAMLATVARGLVRQLPHVTAQSQTHLRDAIAKTAEALATEFEAHGGQKQPHWVD